MVIVLIVACMIPSLEVPEWAGQTDQRLLYLGPVRWAAANGFLLGLGFTSRVGFWGWFLLPIICFSVGDSSKSAAVYGMYGFGRLAAIVVLAALSISRSGAESQSPSWMLGGFRRRVRFAMRLFTVGVAAMCLAVMAI